MNRTLFRRTTPRSAPGTPEWESLLTTFRARGVEANLVNVEGTVCLWVNDPEEGRSVCVPCVGEDDVHAAGRAADAVFPQAWGTPGGAE